MYPTNSSCRKNRSDPSILPCADTHRNSSILSRERNHGIKGRLMGTACTHDTVDLPAPPGPRWAMSSHSPNTIALGVCVSRLAHVAGLLGARWSWLTGSHDASLPLCPPGNLPSVVWRLVGLYITPLSEKWVTKQDHRRYHLIRPTSEGTRK